MSFETRTTEAGASSTLTPEQFREVIGSFASGVTVITANHAGRLVGSTASAVSSLSLEPPMMLICMNRSSSTGRAIAEVGRFAVNILGEDHSDLAVRFATRNVDKFQGLRIDHGLGEVPLLADALATLECSVSQTEIGGTHYVFLARVERARGRLGAPLAYFRGQFGRLELSEDMVVAEAIRDRVLHRTIQIGEPLDLDGLAAEVQAPRSAVYHALAKLAAEGWVERRSDGSLIVPEVTRDSLISSARARVAIFAGAATSALLVGDQDEVGRLRELVARLEPPIDDRADPHIWFSRRTAMIEQLMAMTESGPVLLDAFNRADVPSQIHSFLFGDGATSRQELGPIHDGYASILEACINDDHGAMTDAMRRLLETYDRLYADSLDEGTSAQ
jgi:flavin reductase (DIM6/NTAB) family NADH-FMN oxidoreductase RutF/DNA-binding GntR family transcriptional regulator